MSGKVGAFARAYRSLVACVAAFGIAGAAPLTVQGETREAPVFAPPTMIFKTELMDVPGKQLAVVALTLPPKGVRPNWPHRHPGSVYVYVTQGTARLGLDGQPVREVHTGESFFEPAGALHTVAESASASEPALAIAVSIVPDGAPLTRAENQDGKNPAPSPTQPAQDVSGQERAVQAGSGLLGSPAPGLVMRTIDGQTIDLGSLYGKKAVYLKFWATWCTPCRQQMPHFEHTFETAGADLAVIAVNIGVSDSLEKVIKVRKEFALTMPIVIDDGSLAAAFNLRVTPQHIVIGRSGRIEYVGHLADDRLNAALVAARVSRPEPARFVKVADVKNMRQLKVGGTLPDLDATTLDGGNFRVLDPSDRRPTVLVFFMASCESYLATRRPATAEACRQVREQVERLAGSTPNVRWLGIASGVWATEDELKGYRDRYRTPIPLTLDESGVLFHSFHVRTIPTLVIADSHGVIVRRVEGFDRNLTDQFKPLVAAE
jgi:quercetin dioxygenase-like cupin family protein/peroxiredoxin